MMKNWGSGIMAWCTGTYGESSAPVASQPGADLQVAQATPPAIQPHGRLTALQIAQQSFFGDLQTHPELAMKPVTQDPNTHQYIYRDGKGDVALSDKSQQQTQQQINFAMQEDEWRRNQPCTSAAFVCRARGYER